METGIIRVLFLVFLVLVTVIVVMRVMNNTVIRKQYAQIRQAKEEAERTSTAKSRFLANMSNDGAGAAAERTCKSVHLSSNVLGALFGSAEIGQVIECKGQGGIVFCAGIVDEIQLENIVEFILLVENVHALDKLEL